MLAVRSYAYFAHLCYDSFDSSHTVHLRPIPSIYCTIWNTHLCPTAVETDGVSILLLRCCSSPFFSTSCHPRAARQHETPILQSLGAAFVRVRVLLCRL